MNELITRTLPGAALADPAPDGCGRLPLAGRKVLIIVENLPVPLDRRVWQEATTLVACGAEVSVICPTGRGWDRHHEVIEGVHIYRHGLPLDAESSAFAYFREYTAALWHWFRLAARIRRERGFDVIHGCNPPDLVFLPALWHRLRGVSYIFDHHDVCPELYEAKFGRRGLYWRMMLLWERLNYAAADASIATNESFRKIAITRGRMDPGDVFVVRSAPRLERFAIGPGCPDLRDRAETILGYVGVIGQQEGMDLLVAAVDHLVGAMGKSVHAAIVGFGPGLERMRADVARRGLEAHFTFTGPLYGDALLKVLNSCDIGVSPDPHNAMNDISTMNKVIEYMALGKPVVQFDLTEGRASAGEASLYARGNDPRAFAEAIATLIDSPDLRERLGAEGLRRVRSELCWQNQVPALLAAYERIFAKQDARRRRRATA